MTLVKIQNELKVPKLNENSFGKYKYRSCEDILEAVKPILLANNATLLLSDTIESIGGKVFLKATARLIIMVVGESEIKPPIEVFGYAELAEHKGMSAEQATGTASSYARKYALNGLFLIDETNADADSQEPSKEKPKQDAPKSGIVTTADKLTDLPWLNPKTPEWDGALRSIKAGKTLEDAKKVFRISKTNQELLISEATK